MSKGRRVETVVRRERRACDGGSTYDENFGQVSDTGTGRVLGELEVRNAKLG